MPLRADGRRVAADNLHITLLFMGNIAAHQRDGLCTTSISAPGFSLTLDKLGWWRGPRVIWLAPTTVPAEILSLVSNLAELAADRGIELDNRPYQPHMTLARNITRKPGLPDPAPVHWQVDRFCLVESITSQAGPRYTVLKTWPLTST